MSVVELVEVLRRKGASLTARVMREMYAHPFWELRYGDHGKKNTEDDGSFHLRYVIEALLADDAAVLASYGRWLRTLLVTRGMCTEHLVENFIRLARAIREEIPASERASELLEAATQALVYERDDAGELQRASERLAVASLAKVDASAPWISPFGPMSAAHRRDEAKYLLSYAADAIAADRSELFTKHVAWLDSVAVRHRVAGAPARRLVKAIADAVAEDTTLGGATRAATARLVATNRAAKGVGA